MKCSAICFIGGTSPLEYGGSSEYDNGNGSLMRILPLAFYTFEMKTEDHFEIVHNVSRLTHSHERALIACGIYVQLACELLKGHSKEKAYLCGGYVGSGAVVLFDN